MNRTKKRFVDRANFVFAANSANIKADLDAMQAEHAAKGLLRSGSTIKRAIAIFETRTGNALAQLCDETARMIEHRGRSWREATSGLSDALVAYFPHANDIVQPTINLAGGDRGSAIDAGNNLFASACVRLREQLSGFREGWTAPKAKAWRERHAAFYAIILMLAGVIAGEGARQAVRFIFPEHQATNQK